MREVRRKSSPLTTRFEHMKKNFPNATYVGVADGAPDNWTFLEPFVSYRALDFYLVSEYVADAAEGLFPEVKSQSERKNAIKRKLHDLKHEKGAAQQLNKELQDASPSNNRTASVEKLYKVRTYFKNNWKKMIYPEALENHLPIGSGVTEAASKILVKQRMCRSGMRWKEEGTSMLLTFRALVCSASHWECFWKKINRYGFPLAHNLPVQH